MADEIKLRVTPTTYPRPERPHKFEPVHIHYPFDIPLLPAPLPQTLPSLPSLPRDPQFVPGYTVTTHLVPSAFPRFSAIESLRFPETRDINVSSSLPPGAIQNKAGRTEWASKTADDLFDKRILLETLRRERPNAARPNEANDSPVLWTAVNRYARIKDPSSKKTIGLTVVVAHANGFHKETWEPTFRHIIELCGRPSSGIHIDEIWSLDAVNHGDSSIINDSKLGDVFDWIDHSRDILNFVENYIPDGPYIASKTPLSTHLTRVSNQVSAKRASSGFGERNLVGIGHSFGGCSIANAACARPKLFHSLTLVDAIIFTESREWLTSLVRGALTRRQVWASRKEAHKLLSQNPFFKAWDPEVLDLYIKYGMTEVPESEGGGVRLKMTSFQEAVTFAERSLPGETSQLLEQLDENVKIRWILAGQDMVPARQKLIYDMAWRRQVNTSNVRVPGAGHLIAQEAPLGLAKEVVYAWRVQYAEKMDPVWARLKL